jgi:uncharacterized protein YodC (DUF2158 family)
MKDINSKPLKINIMAKFKSGDTVILKTDNSPEMCVKFYDIDGQVVCNWFLNLELKEATFDENQLEIAR